MVAEESTWLRGGLLVGGEIWLRRRNYLYRVRKCLREGLQCKVEG
jgi:hypothetical protein